MPEIPSLLPEGLLPLKTWLADIEATLKEVESNFQDVKDLFGKLKEKAKGIETESAMLNVHLVNNKKWDAERNCRLPGRTSLEDSWWAPC